ncbi:MULTISPECIES: hypothetical protein [Streptomyces]|uniref:Uncharacterized protein n=1 Tax=Streptomyces lonegramiae TaxID=3075524 RepID=A0ABU2XGZ2_9ACTN|nr:hypothetical protein [Streptomyces sp. DSM 41529]MDT0544360.1 hypothetical protein [Streptomyces sp. DSM 41529]
MSFDSEWSQLKADAAGQQSAHTRLNQLAAAGGGEDGGKASDLIVHQDDLGAVGHEAFVLHGELQMCAHISNHLDHSKKSHANDDELIAASLRNRDGSAVSVSEISKMVK